MKKFFCAFVLLAFSFSTLAQDQKRISVIQDSLKLTLADTIDIRLLTELSTLHTFSNGKLSARYSEEAIKLAEKVDDPKFKVLAYQTAAHNFTSSGNYSSALRYDNLALENDIALRDSSSIAMDYNNIGDDYYDLGEYDDAFFYFTQSLRVAKEADDTLRTLVAMHNVGRVFKELGQYDQALSHLKKSMKMSEQFNDKEGIPYSLNEIADVLFRRQKYDSALMMFMDALTLSRKEKIFLLESVILTKIAGVHVVKNDFSKAKAYYDSAYAIHQKSENKLGMAEIELGRGDALMREKNFDDALQKVEASLALAKSLNARVLEIKCYNQLSALWELKGDHSRALSYYKQFKLLEDTLFSQDMQGKLLRDQVRFETEARDTQSAREQARLVDALKKQQFVRNILVVVMALSGILLITVYRSGQRRRKINMLLLQHQDEMEKRSEELERLNQVKDKFFSIISHDLRSPINALAGLLDLLDKGAVKPEEMHLHTQELKVRFNHTRTLLNNLLDWTLLQMDKLNLQAAKINIHRIVEENIQLLIAVQAKNIKVLNNVPANAIGFADSNTINLVIRNLMTNAIKFTNDGGVVKIDAEERGHEWLISVKDNGVGIKPEVLNILFDKTAPYTTRGTANEKGTGLGLILCKEFVEKNGGKIWAESAEGTGSTFWFTLPKAN
ncbi:tetratricopeptide repeat-containing sensor histidine kinase [Pseudochryseolinea flava]|uniref:tetratricopeptide repeat-containing sensor histidine kinase n=1 Tax=Pseudochryseolinea flava TaxID=2059302 RepID=UPI0014024765|nr:tetratricopeptide repeat-containing sensor histidine kinase [Pseudochryseolinea flava]